jgi:predicted RNA-binding Zn-ribbon protein involved in translation (DUF1610 family)
MAKTPRDFTNEMITFAKSIISKVIESNYHYQYPSTLDPLFTKEFLESISSAEWWKTEELDKKEKAIFFLWYPYTLCPKEYLEELCSALFDRSMIDSDFSHLTDLRRELLVKLKLVELDCKTCGFFVGKVCIDRRKDMCRKYSHWFPKGKPSLSKIRSILNCSNPMCNASFINKNTEPYYYWEEILICPQCGSTLIEKSQEYINTYESHLH